MNSSHKKGVKMFVKKAGRIYQISAKISIVDIEMAKAYIQGAVHSFCKNNCDEPFSVRVLFGGDNKNWEGTPLQCIFDYHKYIARTSKPEGIAARDVGHLLKGVLNEDKLRNYDVSDNFGNEYRMV